MYPEALPVDIKSEIAARIDNLPPEMQEQVLRFVDSLAAPKIKGESGSGLRSFAGCLDPSLPGRWRKPSTKSASGWMLASGRFLLDTNLVIALLAGEAAVLTSLEP